MNAEVSLEELASRMSELLPQLMREINRYESNLVSRGEITVPQFFALDYLTRSESLTMSELADALNLGLSSATGLVDRLIKNGLVTRLRSEDDRRVVTVAITDCGRELLKEYKSQKKKGFMELFRPLTAEERVWYINIIEKLVKELSSR